MCCLCIQFTHENTSERTILHLVQKKIQTPLPGLVACTAKKASYAPGDTSTKGRYFINDWYLEQIFSHYICKYGFIYLQILV